MEASYYGFAEVVQILLNAGADAKAKAGKGSTMVCMCFGGGGRAAIFEWITMLE